MASNAVAWTAGDYDPQFFRYPWIGSADALVPFVIDLVHPRSVVDVGCGTGIWLKTFQRHGVQDILGIDGDWVPLSRLEIPRDAFCAHDLARPLRLGRAFDLAVCLEVAEHLPASAADGLVATLTGLAPVVLFSAAIPGQGGTCHVNEQWPSYWIDRFAERNYLLVDCLRPRFWDDERVEGFYAQNIRLLVRADVLMANDRLIRERQLGEGFPLAAVHPSIYDAAARSRNVGLRTLIGLLPAAAKRAAQRRLRAFSPNGRHAPPG
jgi:SAM-dependent methyltransferase